MAGAKDDKAGGDVAIVIGALAPPTATRTEPATGFTIGRRYGA